MSKPEKVQLDDVVLTDTQRAWLECAYGMGDQIDEVNVARELGDRLPDDFIPYKALGPFWSYNRLSIFGRYKINPKDELLEVMHQIMVSVKEDFSKRPST